ncbi:MAG: hypothetical protein ACTSWY_12010, partial [Promethearchaeota archaeon]
MSIIGTTIKLFPIIKARNRDKIATPIFDPASNNEIRSLRAIFREYMKIPISDKLRPIIIADGVISTTNIKHIIPVIAGINGYNLTLYGRLRNGRFFLNIITLNDKILIEIIIP